MRSCCKMFLVLVLVSSCIYSVQPTAEIMKDVTMGFGEALQHCREESQLTEDQMEEFFHIWSDGFEFKHRELGCAIHCMSKHFNLLTDSSRMHHANTDKFIKSFPQGEKIVQRIIEVIHTCEKKFDHEDDACWRILHIAECFKIQSKKDGLAPDVEMMMSEILLEEES